MRILLLQAGFNELGVIEQLHKMGHYIIAIGNQKGLIGQKEVDEYYDIDYSDKEYVLQFFLDKKMDRVCACCNDTAVLTACYIADKLGLEGYEKYDTAKTIFYKNLFKEYAIQNDISTVAANTFCDLDTAKDYLVSANYPVIVKPIDMSGGKGVSRCDNYSQAMIALHNAFDYAREKKVVVERFVEGSQHGFCTFLKDKKVVACCSNDEYSLINQYRVEVDLFPSSCHDMYKDILIEQTEKMANDLDLADGIFHMQYIVSDGQVYILEAMRRIIGNMYSIPAQKVCGFDWDYWEARANIGQKCDMDTYYDKCLGYYSYRVIAPKHNGVVKDVIIDNRLDKYIFSSIKLWKPNQVVTNYMSETLGILFMQFGSQEEMHRITIDNNDWIKVIME